MSSFALDVSKFVEKAKDRGDLVVRKISLDLLTRIVRRSPVDTGRFRNNWMTSVGSMNSTTSEATDKSGAQAIARAEAALDQARAGDRVFLSNSLPYARRLEYGHSKQAPGGMVRITVQEFQQSVARAVTEARQEIP